MQLTLLGILALGGGILLIHLALNRRPAAVERRRSRSDDGKVIYLFGDAENGSAGDSEAPDAANGKLTDAVFSEADAEKPDDDGKK